MSVRKNAVCSLIGKGAFGVDHEQFERVVDLYLTIRGLAKKHHRLAEMSCNGEGYINGRYYYAGTIDEDVRSRYGINVKSAYVKDDVTVFDQENEKVEAKIYDLVGQLGKGWNVQFQGDPRGNTVSLFCNDSWVNLNL